MKRLFQYLIQEKLVLGIIVLNALVLFLYSFPFFPEPLRRILFAVDYGCTIFFVFELTIKITLWGWTGFWQSKWNRFDFVVVAISLPMLLAPVMNVERFSAVLILRAARVLRTLRLFHFIPDREQIWTGIQRALRASVGVFFALFVYIFILTIFSSHLFGNIAPDYFRDPLISSYSMFRIFTIEGWYEIPDEIARQAGTGFGIFARAYFAFATLTGGILGLSLANAVFVDEMVIDNTRTLEEDVRSMREEMEKLHEKQEDREEKLRTMIERIERKLE